MASLRKRGRVWYYAFTDASGRRVERRGCPDKRATEELARAAESESAKIREGLLDPKDKARREQESRPISEHVAAWGEALAARGGTDRHVSMSVQRVRRLVAIARGAEPAEVEHPRKAGRAERDACEDRLRSWLESGRLADLTPEAVQRGLGALRARGMSLQSLNHHRAAVRSFAIRCRDTNRLRDDPLRGVKGFNAAEDRRHDRRTLSVDELRRLIEAASNGPVVLGMPGATRALCYRLAVASGLRFSELASVRPESFDWKAVPATVSVEAAYTKNGKAAVQPVPDDLAGDLKPFVASAPPGEPVFPLPRGRGAEMLRADLAAAQIP
jgi:integrase